MVLPRRLEEQFAAEAAQTLIGVQLSPGGSHTNAAQQVQQQQQNQQWALGAGPAGARPKPPPTFRAPDDIDTDSEAEDDDPATANSSLPTQPNARLSPAHVLFQAQQQQLLDQARASGNVKAQEVQQQYLQVEQDLQEQLAAVQQELQDKQLAWQEAMAAQSDFQRQQRQRILEAAQQQRASHEAAAARARQAAEAAAQAEKRRAAEEAARKAQQEAEEAARKQQQEAEAAAAAAAEAAAKAAASKQQQQKAAAAGTGASSSTAAAGGSRQPGMAVGSRAADAAAQLRAKLEECEAQVAYLSAPEHKQTLRGIRRKLTPLVTSVSETQKQVMAKREQFRAIYASCNDDDQRMLCLVTLAQLFRVQCESLIIDNRRSAFCLAATAHAIAEEHPLLMQLLVANLQKVCMLLVPQYLMYQKPPAGASAAEQEAVVRDWQQKLGYAFKEAPGGGGQKVAESADDYLRRLVGYVAMFGALVQTTWSPNHLPLSHGWTWFASLLNHLPGNRVTATAVEAYLATAGYAMSRRYRRQFEKLLEFLHTDFLPAVVQKQDGQSVVAKIQEYIQQRQYHQPPEGSVMKVDAESNEIKAGEEKYLDPKVAGRRGNW